MAKLRIILFIFILVVLGGGVTAQVYCPPNIDFELGNLTNWRTDTGHFFRITPAVSVIRTSSSPVIANRHTITSGTALDPYGHFPIVSPFAGSYSLRLGNGLIGAEAEKVTYYVHVPAGVNNYSLIFRFAVVFEDPKHNAWEQPRFLVNGFDSTARALAPTALDTAKANIPCAQYTYVANGTLPGFIKSDTFRTAVSTDTIWYRPWTTSTINLSGYAGKVVGISFTSADCSQTGHFGYGYVDVGCGLFQIDNLDCSFSTTTNLSGPPGFQNYEWRNITFTSVVGVGQNITIPTPAVTTKYALILTPFTGFGCPDTLYTTVRVSNLTLGTGNDTVICKGASAQLNAIVTGSATPYAYNWNSSTGPGTLSCISCTNPIATPLVKTTYYVNVTDTMGCTRTDSIVVDVSDPIISFTHQNVSCFGGSDGTSTANVTNGRPPYTYAWNTVPIQTTATATGLAAGSYAVMVTDALGCTKTATDAISQPTLLIASMASSNVNCFNGSNGTATVTATGGTIPYTYSWNTSPVQTTATASGLAAGTYTATITDAKGCIKTAGITITQPTLLVATITASTNVSCSGGNNGTATVSASGGTSPYTYSWNTSPVQTTATASGLAAGTYTATVTDAKGCIATVNIIITQPTLLTVSTTKTDVNCNGGTTGTATAVVSGGTLPYSYSWNTSPVQTTVTATGLPAGTYTVTVTDANGCIKTAGATIAQPAALALTMSKTNVSCYGGNNGSATVSTSGGTSPYTYSWNTLPVQTTATATSLNAGTFTVTVTDSKGCVAISSVTVTQPAQLAATISSTNVNCYGGSTGTATATATGGTAPFTYNWNTTPVQTTATASALPAGTYSVTITDALGCTTSASITITQPTAALAASITNSVNISCYQGSNGTATVTATGGTSPYTYSWNTTPIQTGATASSLPAGTYTVTVTDNKGCTTAASVTITQPTLLTASITKTPVDCYGGHNGTATVVPAGGTAPYTYSWNTSPIQTTSTANNLSATNYTATVTDAKGCTANTTVTIQAPPPVSGVISKTDVGCNGKHDGSANVGGSGGTSPYSYSWNLSPVQTTPGISGLDTGTFTVTITDSKGCTGTASAVISQPASISATILQTNITCFEQANGTATVTANGGTLPYTYSWSTLPAQTTAKATNLDTGIYSVTVTDANGCTLKIFTDTIKQPTKLVINAVGYKKTCPESNDGAARVTYSGSIKPYTISWSTSPTQTTDTISHLVAGSYFVTVTDANGCKAPYTALVENYPAPVVVLDTDQNICPGKSVTLHAKGAKTYYWSPAGTLSCTTCVATVASPLTTTLYTVIGVDTNGCRDTNDVQVAVLQKIPTEVGPPIIACVGDSVSLHADGGVSYSWSPSIGLNNNNIANPRLDVDSSMLHPSNTLKYKVIIAENECFNDTLYQSATFYLKPTVDLGPDLKGVPGSEIELEAKVTNTTKIVWTPATGLSCYDCLKPIATLTSTITYQAEVSNNGICTAVDDIVIRVACDGSTIFIPNTFTPNGDGLNDWFYISAQGLNMISKFIVYNRWGQEMFKAESFPPNQPELGWDGTYLKKQLSPDVYVYYMEVLCTNGEKIFFKGDVSLVR